MNICLMFPGQGTQKPGMLRELGNKMEEANPVFQVAKEVTGRDIKQLCLSANAEELQKTENTQLAVTAMNLAYLHLLHNDGIKPNITLGHSLGQFSAFVAANVLTLEQVFLIVQKRAELMSNVHRSGMLCSVLGMDMETVGEICKRTDPSSEHLVVALHNTQNQIVIGGEPEYVLKAEEQCISKGALKTVPIRVSNAFHTPLMQGMVQEYAEFIDKIEFGIPRIKVMLNCKGNFAADVQDIKDEIKNQCCHTVFWYEGVKKILNFYPNIVFAETGVGKVLTGMMRSIDNQQKMFMLSNPAQYNKFVNSVKYPAAS